VQLPFRPSVAINKVANHHIIIGAETISFFLCAGRCDFWSGMAAFFFVFVSSLLHFATINQFLR